MVSSRTFVLECRADRVVLAAFKPVGPLLALQRVDAEPLPVGAGGSSAAEWLAAVRVACVTLRRRAQRRTLRVALLLPAPHVLLKAVALPPVSVEQRAQLLPFEAAQAIPYPLCDVAWGAALASETDQGCEMIIAAVKLEVLEPLCSAVEGAGLEVTAVVPAPLATLAGFESPGLVPAGEFLGLNLSADSGTVVFGGAGWRMVRSFRLRADETRRATAAAANESEALTALRAQVVQEVTRSRLHFHWRGSPRQPARVIMMGALSSLPGLGAALANKLGAQVTGLDIPREWKPALARVGEDSSALAGAWLDLGGAARVAAGSAGLNVNLLPVRLQRRAELQRRRPWLVMAASLLLLAGALPPAYLVAQRREVHTQRVAWEQALAPEQARAARNAANLRRIEALRMELKDGAERAHRHLAWRDFIHELASICRDFDGLWFDELSRSGDGSGEVQRWQFKGHLLAEDPDAAERRGGGDEAARLARVLEQLGKMSGIAGIEEVRFDRSLPGLLGFHVTLLGSREKNL